MEFRLQDFKSLQKPGAMLVINFLGIPQKYSQMIYELLNLIEVRLAQFVNKTFSRNGNVTLMRSFAGLNCFRFNFPR